jgi:hypothetical protein
MRHPIQHLQLTSMRLTDASLRFPLDALAKPQLPQLPVRHCIRIQPIPGTSQITAQSTARPP